MKNILEDYLRRLTCAGTGRDFVSVHNKYGIFNIYCLIGPEENIIHLCFTPKKHELAQKRLSGLYKDVNFYRLNQKDFRYNRIFNDYFTGNLSKFPIKIDSPFINGGTPFQQRVWQQISAIPYGSCITYQRLAELAGSHLGARAAGTACGANPLALIIPCHRVIAQNGPGGFGGGLTVKRSLLALEEAGNNCI